MQLRKCGNTDLELSALGIGCWSFGGGDYWGQQDQNDVYAVVHNAIDNGINYFDTAEGYNDGRSEVSLGHALRDVARDKYIIGTKVWPQNSHPDMLTEHFENSLTRLNMDYVDIYMIHWPLNEKTVGHLDKQPTYDDVLAVLLKLQQDGKIRHIGISNHGIPYMKKVNDMNVKYAVNQLPYNLFSRAIEYDTAQFCQDNGVGIITYNTLMQGLLSGKFKSIQDVPPIRTRTRHFDSRKNELSRHGENGFDDEIETALQNLFKLADASNSSLLSLSLQWAIHNPAVTSALIGARNAEQMQSNVDALKPPIFEDVIEEIESITAPLKEKMGTGFDYYENLNYDRTV